MQVYNTANSLMNSFTTAQGSKGPHILGEGVPIVLGEINGSIAPIALILISALPLQRLSTAFQRIQYYSELKRDQENQKVPGLHTGISCCINRKRFHYHPYRKSKIEFLRLFLVILFNYN